MDSYDSIREVTHGEALDLTKLGEQCAHLFLSCIAWYVLNVQSGGIARSTTLCLTSLDSLALGQESFDTNRRASKSSAVELLKTLGSVGVMLEIAETVP